MTVVALPAAGSLSVPPLHGWQGLLVVLAVVLVVAVGFLVVLAVGAMRSGRADATEWQAWLEARTRARHDVRPGSVD